MCVFAPKSLEVTEEESEFESVAEARAEEEAV